MKKKIIPRKDHEVYFLPLPDGIRSRQVKDFSYNELSKLHPSFSNLHTVDLKKLILNKKRWIMATIMRYEDLEEYKILFKNFIFYTNTSIAVGKKDFITNGINKIDDENIGYDNSKEIPISIPLESELNINYHAVKIRTNSIPSSGGVFNKKSKKWFIAPIMAGFISLFLLFFIFLNSGNEIYAYHTDFEHVPINIIQERINSPSSIEILTNFSSDIVRNSGKIISFIYFSNPYPYIKAEIEGLELIKAYEIIDGYEYLSLQDIHDIKYINSLPNYSMLFNIYYDSPPHSLDFPSQANILPILDNLKRNLLETGINLINETFPGINGNSNYSINFTAGDIGLILSLKIISDFISSYPLTVSNMVIFMNTDNSLFNINLSFSYIVQTPTIINIEENSHNIPIAFGFREQRPVFVPVSIPVLQAQTTVLGSIRDG